MTLELNIFNVCKHPGNVDEDVHEVNMIESLVPSKVYDSSLFDPLEARLLEQSSLLEMNENNSENFEFINWLNSSKVLEMKESRQKFEELPPKTNPAVPSSNKTLKLDLKEDLN
ncbi:unnamed protein product, partial [Ilex paraguariensis]